MTNTTLAVGTLTFSLFLGAIYLSSMLQMNHPNDSSIENLRRLREAHRLGVIFDDVLFGSLSYRSFN